MDMLYALTNIEDKFIDEATANTLELLNETSNGKFSIKLNKIAIAAIIFLLAMGTLVYAAYKTNFFVDWFMNPHSQEQFDFESYSNAGIVVDTSKLRIEALESIKSGENVKVALLVTLKELNSAMISGALPQMRGYMFEDVWFSDKYCLTSNIQYFYQSDYSGLKDNQVLLIVNGLFDEPVESVSLSFLDLGYYDDTGVFKREYSGTWLWTYSFIEEDTFYSQYSVGTEIIVSGLAYHLTDIKISMLGCEFIYYLDDWHDWVNKNETEPFFFSEFLLPASEISIKLKDGSSVPMQTYGFQTISNEGYWDGTFRIQSIFEVPIHPELIDSIDYFDCSFQP